MHTRQLRMTNLVCKNPLQQPMMQTQKQQLQILQNIQQNIQELDAKIQFNEKNKKQIYIKPIQLKDKDQQMQNLLNNTPQLFSQALIDAATNGQTNSHQNQEDIINEINQINQEDNCQEQTQSINSQFENLSNTVQTVIHNPDYAQNTSIFNKTKEISQQSQHLSSLDQLLQANNDLSREVTQLREKVQNLTQSLKQTEQDRDSAVTTQNNLQEQLNIQMEEKSKLYEQIQQSTSELARSQASMAALKDISDTDRMNRAIAVARMKRDHRDFFEHRDQKYELIIDDLRKTIDEQEVELKQQRQYIMHLKDKIQELQDEVEAKEMQLIQLQMEPTAAQLHNAMKYLCQQSHTDQSDALKQVFMHLNYYSTADQIIKWISNNQQFIGQFKKNQMIQCDVLADIQRKLEREQKKLEKQKQQFEESSKLSTILSQPKKIPKNSNMISTENVSEAMPDEIKCILDSVAFSKSKISYISNIDKKSKQGTTDKSRSDKNQQDSSNKQLLNRSQSVQQLEKHKLNKDQVNRSASQNQINTNQHRKNGKNSDSNTLNNKFQRPQPQKQSVLNGKNKQQQGNDNNIHNNARQRNSQHMEKELEFVSQCTIDEDENEIKVTSYSKKIYADKGCQTDNEQLNQRKINTTPNVLQYDENHLPIDHNALNDCNNVEKVARQAETDMMLQAQIFNTQQFNNVAKQNNQYQGYKQHNTDLQAIDLQPGTDEKAAQTDDIFQSFQEHNDELTDYIQSLQEMFKQSQSLVQLENSINNIEKYEENTKQLVNRLINVQGQQFLKHRQGNQEVQQNPIKENQPLQTQQHKTTTVDPIASSSIKNQDGSFQYQPTNRPGAVTIQAKRFYGPGAENIVKSMQHSQLQSNFNVNPGSTHQVNKVQGDLMIGNQLPEFNYNSQQTEQVKFKSGNQENIFLTIPEHPRCFINRNDFKITGAPECYVNKQVVTEDASAQCDIDMYKYKIKCDLLKMLPTFYFYLLNNYERVIHFFYDIENDYLKMPVLTTELLEDNIDTIKSYCQHLLGLSGNVERGQLQQAMQQKEYTQIPKLNTFVKYIDIGSLSIQFSQGNQCLKQLFRANFKTETFNNLEYIVIPYHNIQLKPLQIIQKQIKDIIIRYTGMLHEHYKMVSSTKDFVFVTNQNMLTCQETENLFVFLKRYCKEQEAILGATQQNVILYSILVNLAFHQYFDDTIYLFTRLLFDLDYDFLQLYSKIIKYVIATRVEMNNIDIKIISLIFKNMAPSLQKQLIINVNSTESSLRVPFIIAYYQLQRKNAYIMARLSLNFLMKEQMLNRINVNIFSKFCDLMLIKKLGDDRILELFVCNALCSETKQQKTTTGQSHNIELKKKINYHYYLDTQQFMEVFVKYDLSRLVVINFDMLNSLQSIPVKLLNKKLDYLLHMMSKALEHKMLNTPMLKSLLILSKECAFMLDFRSGLNNFMTLVHEAIKVIVEQSPEMAMCILGGSVTLMNKILI